MPAILPREAEALWLDLTHQDVQQLTQLLHPYPAEQLEAYPVSRRINAVQENDAHLLDRMPDHGDQGR